MSEQRPPSRDLRVLVQLFTFLRPYRGAVLAAVIALLVAAAAVLCFGVVLQRVVDQGLSSGSSAALNQALLLFLLVVTVMALSVAARVYLVTWIGERVVADIRKAVFARVLELEPAFFEVTRTGEVISRLTTSVPMPGRTSATVSPGSTMPPYGVPSKPRTRRNSSSAYRRASTPSSANVASVCPAGNVSASPLPGLFCVTRLRCCSMRPPVLWTPRANGWFRRRWNN
jgi:hypothetical protein